MLLPVTGIVTDLSRRQRTQPFWLSGQTVAQTYVLSAMMHGLDEGEFNGNPDALSYLELMTCSRRHILIVTAMKPSDPFWR